MFDTVLIIAFWGTIGFFVIEISKRFRMRAAESASPKEETTRDEDIDSKQIRAAASKKRIFNRVAVIGLLLAIPVYGLIVAAIINEFGMSFFSIMISALMLLPVAALLGLILGGISLLIHLAYRN